MDKDVADSRRKAIDSLAVAIGFWGIDPLESRVFGSLFLSPRPLTTDELAADIGQDGGRVEEKLKVLQRLGAVKEVKAGDESRYQAEADFFEILQKVLRERQEKEMGAALQEISDQKAFMEWKYDEEGEADLKFMAERLAKLERFIHLIDKAMFGLKALSGLRGMLRLK